jgi:hypothetical protein
MKHLFILLILFSGCSSPEQKVQLIESLEPELMLIDTLKSPYENQPQISKYTDVPYLQKLIPLNDKGFVFNYTSYKGEIPFIQPVLITRQNKVIRLPLIEVQTDFRDICDKEVYIPTENRYLLNDNYIFEFKLIYPNIDLHITRIDLKNPLAKPLVSIVSGITNQLEQDASKTHKWTITNDIKTISIDTSNAIILLSCWQNPINTDRIINHRYVPVLININSLKAHLVLVHSFPKIILKDDDFEAQNKKYDPDLAWEYGGTLGPTTYFFQKTSHVQNKNIAEVNWHIIKVNYDNQILKTKKILIKPDSLVILKEYQYGIAGFSAFSRFLFDYPSSCFYSVSLCQTRHKNYCWFIQKIDLDGNIIWQTSSESKKIPFGGFYHMSNLSIESQNISLHLGSEGKYYHSFISKANGQLINEYSTDNPLPIETDKYLRLKTSLDSFNRVEELEYIGNNSLHQSMVRLTNDDCFTVLYSKSDSSYFIYRYK